MILCVYLSIGVTHRNVCNGLFQCVKTTGRLFFFVLFVFHGFCNKQYFSNWEKRNRYDFKTLSWIYKFG